MCGWKEDGKAWAQIPAGYVGIDDAVQALSSGSGELTVKAFVDDTTELETLVSSIASTPATSVNLDLKANSKIKAIENGQFKSNTKLKGITIPDTISSVGNDAFNGCSSLTTVTLPNSLTRIAERSFTSCSKLVTIGITSNVTFIGAYAFDGCSSLTSVEFYSGNTQWTLTPTSSSVSKTHITGTPAENAEALKNTYLQYNWNK